MGTTQARARLAFVGLGAAALSLQGVFACSATKRNFGSLDGAGDGGTVAGGANGSGISGSSAGHGAGARDNSGTAGTGNAGEGGAAGVAGSDQGAAGGGTAGALGGGGSSGSGDGTAVGTLNQPCSPEGAYACAGHAQKGQLVCSGGKWSVNATCPSGNNCDSTLGNDAGACAPILAQCSAPGVTFCSQESVAKCGVDLVTVTTTACAEGYCNGASVCGVCKTGTTRCAVGGVQICSATGTWGDSAACPAIAPACSNGACVNPPSCVGLAATCGPNNSASCCSTAVVPGGTFNRSNNAAYPATVSDFDLDTYEISVGRFRKFVAGYPGDLPANGSGKNPANPADPGWDATWASDLPSQSDLTSAISQCDFGTWSGANDSRPMNCLGWYEAEAFCIWDGGRLPTEAEWNYAAAGGAEQRAYPWGNTAPGVNASLAVYGCFYNGNAGSCPDLIRLAPVGEVSAGNGKWGQADLAGNVTEWTQDSLGTNDDPMFPSPCNNCAYLKDTGFRMQRGGSYDVDASQILSSYRFGNDPRGGNYQIGARCARTR